MKEGSVLMEEGNVSMPCKEVCTKISLEGDYKEKYASMGKKDFTRILKEIELHRIGEYIETGSNAIHIGPTNGELCGRCSKQSLDSFIIDFPEWCFLGISAFCRGVRPKYWERLDFDRVCKYHDDYADGGTRTNESAHKAVKLLVGAISRSKHEVSNAFTCICEYLYYPSKEERALIWNVFHDKIKKHYS
jgi:hypothetical protein